MKKILAIALFVAASSNVYAADSGALIGGALGGAAGAAVGYNMGGQDGAILGAAIGGATGVAIGSQPDPVAAPAPRRQYYRDAGDGSRHERKRRHKRDHEHDD